MREDLASKYVVQHEQQWDLFEQMGFELDVSQYSRDTTRVMIDLKEYALTVN